MTSSDKIAEALFECIVNAPLSNQKALFQALGEFSTKYSRSYQGVCRQPFARKLVTTIEDADEFVNAMETENN